MWRSDDVINGCQATASHGVNGGEFMRGWRLSTSKTCNRVSRILVATGFAVALGGCEPVQSVEPFFEAKDAFLDANLNGKWAKEEDGFGIRLLFQEGHDQIPGYKVEVTFQNGQPEKDKPKEGTITFSVHLFQVGGYRYADFYPLVYSAKTGSQTIEFEATDNLFGMPTHTVYLVRLQKKRLCLKWLEYTGVDRYLAKNKLPLAAKGTDCLVLIGKTEELKTNLLLQAEKEDLLEHDGLEFMRKE